MVEMDHKMALMHLKLCWETFGRGSAFCWLGSLTLKRQMKRL